MRQALCLILALGSVPEAHAQDETKLPPGRLAKAVFCEAMLRHGPNVSTGNPLASLRDLQDLLRKRREIKTSVTENPDDSYLAWNYRLDLSKKSLRPMDGFETAGMLARLAQLESDTTNIRFDGSYVGYEIRGVENVRRAKEAMVSEISSLNPQILAQLRERYPTVRRSTVIQRAASAYFLIAPAYFYFLEPQYWRLGVVLAPFGIMLSGFNEFVVPWIGSLHSANGVRKQFDLIDSVLAGKTAGAPASLFTSNVKIKSELHNLFMNLQNQELSEDEMKMIVDASESMFKIYFDKAWLERETDEAMRGMSIKERFHYLNNLALEEARQFPEGRERHAYFDSLFYVDPQTGEPVWLLYYRAFKNEPIPPRAPKREKPEVERERSWGVAPGLSPIPVLGR